MSLGLTVLPSFIVFSDLTSPLLNLHRCPRWSTLLLFILSHLSYSSDLKNTLSSSYHISSIFWISGLNPSNLLHILLICVDNITCMSHSFPLTCPTMYSSQSILCVPPLLLFSFSLYTPALPLSTTTFSLILPFHVLQKLSLLLSAHLEAPSECCPSTSLKPPLTFSPSFYHTTEQLEPCC